jgi:hypothetical protein
MALALEITPISHKLAHAHKVQYFNFTPPEGNCTIEILKGPYEHLGAIRTTTSGYRQTIREPYP